MCLIVLKFKKQYKVLVCSTVLFFLNKSARIKGILFMVGCVATGIIFAVLESPKSFTGTRHVRNYQIIILDIAAREHPHAGSKQMATYQAVVAQTQSSSSSSNLCCSVATQTWSAHHVACWLLHTIHYASSINAVWRTPIQPRPQTALLLLLLYIFSRTRSSSMLAALLSFPLFFPPLYFFH